MIELKMLETFLWVANLRSFRGAAEKLNTTQPAVSMRIAQLEEILGTRLLERDRRAVAPTQKGKELLGYAERMLKLRAEMTDAVGDRTTMRGIVRVGVSETIVHTWLPTLIDRVNKSYPNVELEIEVDISPNLRDRLLLKDLDLAFLLGPVGNPSLQWRPLCSFPIGFIASPKLGLGDKLVPLTEIVKRPLITFSRNTQPYIALRELLDRKGLQATIHASASLATVVRMALDGMGVAVLPPVVIGIVPPAGRLKQIKTEAKMPRFDYVVSWAATPDSFAAQKVAEIALSVAKRFKAPASG